MTENSKPLAGVPSRDQYDDAQAWRLYAADLRIALGERKEKLNEFRTKITDLDGKLQRARHAQVRERHLLNAIEQDLNDGDIASAVDRLAERRAMIEQALEQRREEREASLVV